MTTGILTPRAAAIHTALNSVYATNDSTAWIAATTTLSLAASLDAKWETLVQRVAHLDADDPNGLAYEVMLSIWCWFPGGGTAEIAAVKVCKAVDNLNAAANLNIAQAAGRLTRLNPPASLALALQNALTGSEGDAAIHTAEQAAILARTATEFIAAHIAAQDALRSTEGLERPRALNATLATDFANDFEWAQIMVTSLAPALPTADEN